MELVILTIIYCGWLFAMFAMGYVFGKTHNHTITEDIVALKKKLDKSPVGLVKRPTAETLYYRKNPKLAEEETAMKDAFKKIKDES